MVVAFLAALLQAIKAIAELVKAYLEKKKVTPNVSLGATNQICESSCCLQLPRQLLTPVTSWGRSLSYFI